MVAAMTEHAHEHGYLAHDNKDDYLKRLRRIEGQARGLQRMVEEEKYCIDILTQVSAMTKALQSVALDAARRPPGPLRRRRRRARAAPRPRSRSRRPPTPSPGSSGPDHTDREEIPMTQTQTYTVTGMTCGHCVASVTEEVQEIPGVAARRRRSSTPARSPSPATSPSTTPPCGPPSRRPATSSA